MQILQWVFKGAHEQERESSILSPSTKKEAINDQNDKKKDIVLLKHHRAYGRTKRIEGSKLGCKNLKIFAFICGKDISKACFYSTLNLKRFESDKRTRQFVDSMKMKREEVFRGVGNTNKADSAAHVGNKVLPITKASVSATSTKRNDQGRTTETKDQIQVHVDKKKPISRMKELLRWAATAKTEKGGKNGQKVLQFRRRGTIKAVPDDDEEVSSDSPKIGFSWDVESCSTTSSAYSATSVASSSINGRTQIAPSPISIPPITGRKGNWITTDSEFVVLEL